MDSWVYYVYMRFGGVSRCDYLGIYEHWWCVVICVVRNGKTMGRRQVSLYVKDLVEGQDRMKRIKKNSGNLKQ
mgnify:FL=1